MLCSQSLSGETSNLSQAKQPQSFVKHTLSPGLIMAGYQGWFNTPDDGAGRGWYHYSKEGKFEPGYAKVDMWPEMDEYEKAYQTAFRFADGSPATTFSSFDESTVRLHFRWMQSYGIDGVYLQRFVAEIKTESGRKHFTKVMTSAAKAALDYDRTLAVMYDMSGMRSEDTNVIVADWKALMAQFGFTQHNRYGNYLQHGNRPVVAIWGVGFNDNRRYNLDDIEKLIRFFQSAEGGNCSVMLGVPTYWRQQGNDCIKDPRFPEVVKMANIVHPWFVGRFNEAGYDAFRPLIGEDLKWCNAHNLAYIPVVFPGFSWNNMYPDSKNSFV
ncbi:MAG: glycoside hydrolase family 71/99-like protein, partial [Bacteroidales bacterium]